MEEDKNIECDLCYETKDSKIKDITLIVNRENPEAYGYPEVVYWKEKYQVGNCPKCGREF